MYRISTSMAVPLIVSGLNRPETPNAFVGTLIYSQRPNDHLSVIVSYGRFSLSVIPPTNVRYPVREPTLCIDNDELIIGDLLAFLTLLASLLPEPYLRRLLRRNADRIAGEVRVIQFGPSLRVEQIDLPSAQRGRFVTLVTNTGEALPPILIYRVNDRDPIYTATPLMTSCPRLPSEASVEDRTNKRLPNQFTIQIPHSHYDDLRAKISLTPTMNIKLVPLQAPPGIYLTKRMVTVLQLTETLSDIDVCIDHWSHR